MCGLEGFLGEGGHGGKFYFKFRSHLDLYTLIFKKKEEKEGNKQLYLRLIYPK